MKTHGRSNPCLNARFAGALCEDGQMSDPTVDARQPWLGLNSFTESTRPYFYGREEEIAELARRVQRKLLTVLFGQSGLGKTSILRAGLVLRLRPEGYCPVYVRLDYGADSPPPAEQIKQAVFRETQASGTWSQAGAAVEDESLWEFLHHRGDVLRDADGRTLIPLLIFDQFEEIFTHAQGNDFGRARAAQFVDELADLVENRAPRALESRLDADEGIVDRFDFARCDYRVLIALREDYLAHLESVKAQMPSITQNRMRLAPMTGAQALDAVRKPGGSLVNEEVAEAIVRFIAGGAELRNAEVEPALLSLICRELNNTRIAQGRSEISADLLAGSRDGILADFYERALADQVPGVRKFIEDEMLTDSGFRESLAEERVTKGFASAGAPPGALATLVDRRLLRIEERLDRRRAELTHDVLCGVVAASRELRHEREARDEAERQLAAQREREAATYQALLRARKVAAVCAVLALVAIGAAGFGVWGMQRAQTSRALAETARTESERLITYLLDDFQRELAPIGRVGVVGELAKRTIDYYQALPAELRQPDTQRSLALAQVSYAKVLFAQGKPAEARPALDAAVAALDALRAQGDTSEPTAIGLSAGLAAQAVAVYSGGGTDRDALPLAERAVAVLPLAAAANGASLALRRARAAALSRLGWVLYGGEQDLAANESLRAALAAYRSIDERWADGSAAAGFGQASATLVENLIRLGRLADAEQAGEEGLRVATLLLDREPTNLLALRSRASILGILGVAASADLNSSRRLVLADNATRDWALLARIDPGDKGLTAELISSRMNAALALRDQGRLNEALGRLRDNQEFEPLAATSSAVAQALWASFYWAAITAAELGQAAVAERLFADCLRHRDTTRRGLSPDSFRFAIFGANMSGPVELAHLSGDPARARAEAKGRREALMQLQPPDVVNQEFRASILGRLHRALGWAELQAGAFAAAEQQFRLAAEARQQAPVRSLRARLGAADDAALQAIALAFGGHSAEARVLAEPALAWQREQQPLMSDYPLHHRSLALALLAVARSTPAKGPPLLAEAQAALDRLPAEWRAERKSRTLQGLIDDARRSAQ